MTPVKQQYLLIALSSPCSWESLTLKNQLTSDKISNILFTDIFIQDN